MNPLAGLATSLAIASGSVEVPKFPRDEAGEKVTYRYRLDDRRTIWLEERAHAAFDANGRMTQLRGMSADVTERLAADSALREADRAKDRFIATLSHELRNPLAPIRNAAEALRRGEYEKAVVSLTTVRAATNATLEQGMAVHQSTVQLEARLAAEIAAGNEAATRAYGLLKAMKAK